MDLSVKVILTHISVILRRWVINMLSGRCSTLQDIIERESELVEKFAEV